jgi:hypothetical protein
MTSEIPYFVISDSVTTEDRKNTVTVLQGPMSIPKNCHVERPTLAREICLPVPHRKADSSISPNDKRGWRFEDRVAQALLPAFVPSRGTKYR